MGLGILGAGLEPGRIELEEPITQAFLAPTHFQRTSNQKSKPKFPRDETAPGSNLSSASLLDTRSASSPSASSLLFVKAAPPVVSSETVFTQG